jgi:hypothetical protein
MGGDKHSTTIDRHYKQDVMTEVSIRKVYRSRIDSLDVVSVYYTPRFRPNQHVPPFPKFESLKKVHQNPPRYGVSRSVIRAAVCASVSPARQTWIWCWCPCFDARYRPPPVPAPPLSICVFVLVGVSLSVSQRVRIK